MKSFKSMIPLGAGEAEHIVAPVARPHNFIIKKSY